MPNPLHALCEERIRESIKRGELDDLPGKGEPLELDDDTAVPEHLRAAYRILKNANCLPPELEARREIQDIETLLAAIDPNDTERRDKLGKRLAVLEFRLGRRLNLSAPRE